MKGKGRGRWVKEEKEEAKTLVPLFVFHGSQKVVDRKL